MKIQKILEITQERCRRFFENHNIGRKEFPSNEIPKSPIEILSHCHWMLDEIKNFISQGRIGKAFRWLGFIQGCLWVLGYFSLEEIRGHSRSE